MHVYHLCYIICAWSALENFNVLYILSTGRGDILVFALFRGQKWNTKYVWSHHSQINFNRTCKSWDSKLSSLNKRIQCSHSILLIYSSPFIRIKYSFIKIG